jgi:hypothetical protein
MRCIYQDGDVVVVDKPFGLRSVPAFQAADESKAHVADEASGRGSGCVDGGSPTDEYKASLLLPVNKRKRQERFSDVLGMLGAGFRTISSPPAASTDHSALEAIEGLPANLGPHLVKLAAERDSVPRKRGFIECFDVFDI